MFSVLTLKRENLELDLLSSRIYRVCRKMQQVQIARTLLIAQSGNNRFALSRSRSRGDQGRDVNGKAPRDRSKYSWFTFFAFCLSQSLRLTRICIRQPFRHTIGCARFLLHPLFSQLIILKGDTDDGFKLKLNLTR